MIYEKKAHTAIIKIEESEKSGKSLERLLTALNQDQEVYVLILAGADLEKALELLPQERKKQLTKEMQKLRVPVIAASGEMLPEAYLGCDLIVSGADFLEEAEALAEEIAKNAPLAVQQIKRCVNLGMKNDIDTGLAYELQAFSLCHSSREKEIRMKKLIDKREHTEG